LLNYPTNISNKEINYKENKLIIERANKAYSYEFVKEFIELKGCKLISNTYVRNTDFLKIECTCGREFDRSFAKFKNSKRYKCNVCTGKTKYGFEEALELLEKYCKLKPKNIFINSSKKQTFICIECGNEVTTYPHTIIKNKVHACFRCNTNYLDYSYDGIKHYIENNSHCKLLDTEYESYESKIELECSCKTRFYTTFKKFKNKNKRQCDNCSGYVIRSYAYIRYNIEKNVSTLLTSECDYENTRQVMRIKCWKCGETYEQDFISYISNKHRSCFKCSHVLNGLGRRYTHEYVYDYIKNRGCKLISKYEKSNEYIDIECSCKKIFTTTFNEFNTGNKRRCNSCRGTVSNGEKFIMDWLDSIGIKYIHQKSFKDCIHINTLPFDFYIPEKNIAIEVDGFLHREYVEYFFKKYSNFLKCVYRDSIKTKYCKDHDIKLFRIKYDDIKDIEGWIDKNEQFILR